MTEQESKLYVEVVGPLIRPMPKTAREIARACDAIQRALADRGIVAKASLSIDSTGSRFIEVFRDGQDIPAFIVRIPEYLGDPSEDVP